MKKSIFFVVAMLLVASMVLGACAQPTETPVVTEPPRGN